MRCVELALSSSGLYATTRIGAIHSVVQRHRTRKPQAALGAHAAAADARLCEYFHVGTNGERQPSRDGTSRMRRESQVRICERLGVKSPGRLSTC